MIGETQQEAQQQRRKTLIPGPFNGHENRRGEKGPKPGCTQGSARAVNSLGEEIDGVAGQRRKNDVENLGKDGQRMASQMEEKLAKRDEPWVHGGEPCRGEDVVRERFCKTVAGGERIRNHQGFQTPAHKTAVNHVLVMVREPEKEETQQEGSSDRGARRTKHHGQQDARAAQRPKSCLFQAWPSENSR